MPTLILVTFTLNKKRTQNWTLTNETLMKIHTTKLMFFIPLSYLYVFLQFTKTSKYYCYIFYLALIIMHFTFFTK